MLYIGYRNDYNLIIIYSNHEILTPFRQEIQITKVARLLPDSIQRRNGLDLMHIHIHNSALLHKHTHMDERTTYVGKQTWF